MQEYNLFKEKRAFLFDVSDTLVYTLKNGYKKIIAVAKICGFPAIDYKTYVEMYGKHTFDECISLLFPECDVTYFRKLYNNQNKIIPYEAVGDFGTIQNELLQRGILCGVLTNERNDYMLQKKMRAIHAKIEDLIGIWGRNDIPFTKPDSRALDPVLANFSRSEILYIGDSLTDYYFCEKAKIDFLHVQTGKDVYIEDCFSVKSINHIIELYDMQCST